MIIPLDKLLTYRENKYVFTRAAMNSVDRIGNMSVYPENEESWKVVPNILKIVLDEKVQFQLEETPD